MALFQRFLLLLLLFPVLLIGQYTDVINSNRPGLSVSAYAVGKNVVQAEFGLLYEKQDHSVLNTNSTIFGSDLALRYGFLFEALEISYEGTFVKDQLTYANFGLEETRTDFTRNRLGIKYLVYDPFKNPEANKPNIRSWKANHKFRLKNLLPAVSVYGGATFNLGDNPYYPEDATISYRGMVAAQSRLTPRWVLIANVAYDRITTDFPELSYIISVSHALRNPKWSLFVEHQGIDSDRYADALIRGGIAHLFGTNFQADISFGGSFKTTPSRTFVSGGFSYRLDFHKDELKAIDDQKSTTKIKRKDVKRKKHKKKDKIDF